MTSFSVKKDRFVRSGFENFEQLMLVMTSEVPLTHKVLETELGIKKLGHRHRILGSLHEEAAKWERYTVIAETTGRKSQCVECVII